MYGSKIAGQLVPDIVDHLYPYKCPALSTLPPVAIDVLARATLVLPAYRPWRSVDNCSCIIYTSTIPGGRILSFENFLHRV